MAYEELDKFQG